MLKNSDQRGTVDYGRGKIINGLRWLEESTRGRAAFQAFGEGPRMCIGMRLAYIEEKIALIELMKRFTIEKTVNTVENGRRKRE